MTISLLESSQNKNSWDALQKAVDSLLKPSKTALQPAQEAIRGGFNENFLTQSAAGTPWQPLAFATIIERILIGFSAGPILQRTGHYRSSFVDFGHADHVSEIEQDSGTTHLFEGSDDKRVSLLELGNRRVPARPVLVLSDAAIENVAGKLEEMVSKILYVN